MHLWVVLGISSVQSNRLEIESDFEVHGSYDVPERSDKGNERSGVSHSDLTLSHRARDGGSKTAVAVTQGSSPLRAVQTTNSRPGYLLQDWQG